MIGARTADPSSTLRFARVSFTGRPVSMTWREAGEIVRTAGGEVTTSVSRRTSMLVVGLDGWPVLQDGTVSRKLVRAEELNERGATIEIVSEAVFLERAGRAPASATGSKTYSLEQVCDVLDLAPRVLKRWEALGLVRSDDGQYDFQDLVSLREIAELIGRGVAPSTLARSVRELARVLPDTERPLAQLKVVEGAGELVAELGDALLAPDGQLVLRFDGPVPEVEMGSLRRTAKPEMRTASDWFDEAHACEDEERFEEAIPSYRKALRAAVAIPRGALQPGQRPPRGRAPGGGGGAAPDGRPPGAGDGERVVQPRGRAGGARAARRRDRELERGAARAPELRRRPLQPRALLRGRRSTRRRAPSLARVPPARPEQPLGVAGAGSPGAARGL